MKLYIFVFTPQNTDGLPSKYSDRSDLYKERAYGWITGGSKLDHCSDMFREFHQRVILTKKKILGCY